MDPIIIGISGGSGAILAKLAVESLLSKNIQVIFGLLTTWDIGMRETDSMTKLLTAGKDACQLTQSCGLLTQVWECGQRVTMILPLLQSFSKLL